MHVKHEAKHYWSATKLLAADTRIATRLLFKSLGTETLTRRERRQVPAPAARRARAVLQFDSACRRCPQPPSSPVALHARYARLCTASAHTRAPTFKRRLLTHGAPRPGVV